MYTDGMHKSNLANNAIERLALLLHINKIIVLDINKMD